MNHTQNNAVRISFIATTKNRGGTLRSTIAGWQKLKSVDDELIVIDGGSRDGSVEILRDSEFVVDDWVSEEDLSEAHAINKGILRAKGRYVKFLTDDDIFHANAINRCSEILDADPEIDFLHAGGECVVAGAGGPPKTLWFQKWEGTPSSLWWATRCGLGLLVRRSAFAQFGLFDVRHKLCDTSLLIQATLRGAQHAFVMEKMYTHLRQGSSYTGNASSQTIRRHMRIMARDFDLPAAWRLEWFYPRLGFFRDPKGYLQRYLAYRRDNRLPVEPTWTGELYR